MNELKTIYFVGIGGIGMSALARYLHSIGKDVYGYDKTETELTKKLVSEGMIVHYEDNELLLPENIDLVVYTPAIPKNNRILSFLKESVGCDVIKRAELLGRLSKARKTIAIAGTHGKTSTSATTAHLLKVGGIDSSAFIGGIMSNYDSNYIEGAGDWIVVEADEYDRSFHHLSPDIAAVMSMDADHLDIYGNGEEMQKSFESFLCNVKFEGLILLRNGLLERISDDTLLKLADKQIVLLEFGIENDLEIRAQKIRIEDGRFHFEFYDSENGSLTLSTNMGGRHNIENAVAAIAIAIALGVEDESLVSGMESFKGIKRRFEKHIDKEEMIYIDDYAHHPTELRAAIGAVKELYPEKKISGVFQPHLYSRTRDFVDGFAEALDELDIIYLMDIYPAREAPIEGITSDIIYQKLKTKNKSRVTKETLMDELRKQKHEVLITLGAGDIDVFVDKIKTELGRKLD